MKERLYDVIKWGLIIIIAGLVFHFVYPKYECIHVLEHPGMVHRYNKITGKIELGAVGVNWKTVGEKGD